MHGMCRHAFCRQMARGINYWVPNLCPVKDTDRVWGDRTSGPVVRATLLSYILREHSFVGLFFAPQSRATDLHKGQLLLTFVLGLVVALYLSMEFSESHSDWMDTWWEWIPIFGVNIVAAFTKVCYKSGLKRTYFCIVKSPGLLVRGIKVASGGGFIIKGKPAKAVHTVMRLGLGEFRTTMNWDSSANAWISDSSQEPRLPLKYEELGVAVLQILHDGTEQVIGRTGCDITRFCLEPGSSNSLSLDLDKGKSGKVEFLMCVVRDEPISPLSLLLAVLRPITECVLLRCCCLVMCLPCCLCLRRHPRHGKAGKPGASPAEAPAAGSRGSWGLPGVLWRAILYIIAAVVVAAVSVHVESVVLSNDTLKRHNLKLAAKLFIKAKVFCWVVTEPGALMWTYCTMRSLCPKLLPQQSLESYDPRPPPFSAAVDPVAVFDGPGSPLLDPSTPGSSKAQKPGKPGAGECALQ
mmetsp:Transcript_38576/g.120496  ORF Transcript_38576/g.120496 Transcript_38576/m.120496 type:complete len:465 (-) Transcript_38576:142-1536(-)